LPHRVRQLAALARAGLGDLPAKSLYDASAAAIRRAKDALASSTHDLVVFNGGDLYFLAHVLAPSRPSIGLALNVEGDLYETQTAGIRALPFAGRYVARDLAKLRRVEADGLRRLGGIVCVSSEDAARFATIAPDTPRLVLPTTFDYVPYEREAARGVRRPLRLGLLAKYRWWPNAEAVEWFIGNVLSKLPAGCAELHLFGYGAQRFSGRHPAVVVHGFVADLHEVWRDSDVVVCPIVSGSGINVKLVEAVYNRVPVIATSHALRGLPPLDDPAIVRLDGAEAWIEFLAGPEVEALARRIPSRAVSERFSTRAAAPALAEFVRAVIAAAR
jgi:hypothetical protein